MANQAEKKNIVVRTLGRVDQTIGRAAERPGVVRHLVHVIQVAVMGVRKNNLTRMAAALSYRTIFGLVPVLLVGVLLLKATVSPEAKEAGIKQLLHFTGIDQVTVSSEPIEGDPSKALAAGESSKGLSVDEWISSRVKDVESAPSGAVGILGVIMLVYAALTMVVEIEKSFNSLCAAPTGRRWSRRITLYWTLLTLGTLLLIGSFLLTEQATSSLRKLAEGGGISAWFGGLSQVALYVSSLLISTIMFVIMYTTVPNTRVKFGPAVLGAVIAAIFWELGKRGFTAYVGYATKNLRQMYGAVAILPLLMLWIYLTWVIVLIGLQIAHSVQTYRAAATQGLTRGMLASLGLIDGKDVNEGPKVVDPASILTLAVAIAARFAKGKSADASELADAVGIEERTVTDMLERLARAGIVHRVAGGAEADSTLTLARPAEAISAVEVLRLGDELADAGGRKARPGFLEEMIRARNLALAGKTLADLLPGAGGLTDGLSAASSPASPVSL